MAKIKLHQLVSERRGPACDSAKTSRHCCGLQWSCPVPALRNAEAGCNLSDLPFNHLFVSFPIDLDDEPPTVLLTLFAKDPILERFRRVTARVAGCHGAGADLTVPRPNNVDPPPDLLLLAESALRVLGPPCPFWNGLL